MILKQLFLARERREDQRNLDTTKSENIVGARKPKASQRKLLSHSRPVSWSLRSFLYSMSYWTVKHSNLFGMLMKDLVRWTARVTEFIIQIRTLLRIEGVITTALGNRHGQNAGQTKNAWSCAQETLRE